ncbi:MAG: SdrD B-like domain-containing protein [Saprospiraceae bacterium]
MKQHFITRSLMMVLLALMAGISMAQNYDLALRLNSIANSPVKYGVSVPFNITVYNQGTQSVDSIDVICILNSNLQLGAGNGIWSAEGSISNAYVTRIAGQLDPAASVLVTINVVPQPGVDSTQWNLSAEIFAFQDISGNQVENFETDSTPDKNNTNDGGGALGTPSDDAINGNGTGLPGSANANTDEDDHDVAKVRIYDVALKKLLLTTGQVHYGDVLDFVCIVYNQGNETTGLVTIQELITEGYIWDQALNLPLGWVGTAPKPKYSFEGLAPGDSLVVPVKLRLDSEQFDGAAWNNYTEVFTVFDIYSNNVNVNEADSEPNSNSIYENQVLPGSAWDNEINGNGPGANEDEDDHDVAAPRIFDLAIKKERETSVPSYSYTQNVKYTITVYNQGNVAASQVTITDTIPCGLEFIPALNPQWAVSGPNKISRVINTPLAPATNAAYELYFGVNPCYNDPANGWTNYIEISSAIAADGGSNADIDGVFDSNLKNDYQYNNLNNNDVLNQWGTAVNQDEDNHDLEIVQVVDLALKKTLVTPPPYTYGQNLTFAITIYNQGNVVGKNIKIRDYVPEGYDFPAGLNIPLGWNMADSTNTLSQWLYPDQQTTINIVLTVKPGNSRRDWINYAHIVLVQDTFNNNRFDDADSYTFMVNAAEFAIDPGDPEDDDIFVLGPPNTNTDEDDHDPAGFEVFDLMLEKSVVNPQPYYVVGDLVPFNIRVTNQGGTAASYIQITDYLPCGFSFNAGINPGWTQSGNLLRYQSSANISHGQSITVPLQLNVVACNTANAYRNVAEISISRDSLNTGNKDFDSTADENPGNDAAGEDDIDDAIITVVNGAIGGIVWNDFDADGIYDAGENYTQGVRVELRNCNQSLIKFTNTNASGAYEFTDLPAGNYLVYFVPTTLPLNAIYTLQNQGNNDDLDSDVNANGFTACFSLAAGQSNYTIDAGHFSPSSIGDFVWNDLNGNNLQDGNEPGVMGVNVMLLSPSGSMVASTFTNASGLYLFSNVTPGNYYLKFSAPADYQFILANTGNNDNTDSDVTGELGAGTTAIFAVPGSTNITNMDAGLAACARIGSLVWYDVDKDDIWDSYENGINGLKVELWRNINNNWSLFDYTHTGHKPNTPSDDGYFSFCAPPGTYYIRIIMPPLGLVQARANIFGELPLNAPNEQKNDSDLTNTFGPSTTRSFTVSSGQIIENIGAGFYPMATAGNLVWEDSNFNGRQEAGEPRVANVLVEAFDANDLKIGESTTNSEGIYKIEYLGKEKYYLKFTPPTGYSYTMANLGDEDTDSDVDHSHGLNTTSFFTMVPGENYVNIDAGLAIGALPVRYADLHAEWKGDRNLISWKTATEINASHFIIERYNETEGDYEAQGKVLAHGNSATLQQYKWEDFDLARAGTYTYRLSQYDFDGTVNFSPQVSVYVHKEEKVNLEVRPNPAKEKAVVKMNVPSIYDRVEVVVTDMKGIQHFSAMIDNTTQYELPIEGLAAGVYHVCIHYGLSNECTRVIVIE